MLKSNTIRFTTDTFGQAVEFIDEPIDIQPDDPDAPDTPTEQSFMKQALLISKKLVRRVRLKEQVLRKKRLVSLLVLTPLIQLLKRKSQSLFLTMF